MLSYQRGCASNDVFRTMSLLKVYLYHWDNYQFTLALATPLWLARSDSSAKRWRAAAIPLAAALSVQMGVRAFNLVGQAYQAEYQLNALDVVSTIWGQLLVAAALVLAMHLYSSASRGSAHRLAEIAQG